MKPVRELMKDQRVAGGLAAVALLFVVYRVTHTGRPSAPPPAPDNGTSASASTAPGDNGAARPNAAFAPAGGDNAAAASVPKGTVAWNWERNPFIGPAKKQALPAGEEEFPTIIVPGFGGKAPAAIPDAASAGDPRPKDPGAPAAEPLPDLRGTVLSGGRGIAIFGSRLVPPGEQVAGWTVDRVTAYDVTLRKGSERRTIGVFKPGSAEEKGGKP